MRVAIGPILMFSILEKNDFCRASLRRENIQTSPGNKGWSLNDGFY